jgi:hypothetical protein
MRDALSALPRTCWSSKPFKTLESALMRVLTHVCAVFMTCVQALPPLEDKKKKKKGGGGGGEKGKKKK